MEVRTSLMSAGSNPAGVVRCKMPDLLLGETTVRPVAMAREMRRLVRLGGKGSGILTVNIVAIGGEELCLT
jgi:hypothetical protein